MTMHHNEFVCTINDSNRKRFGEYKHKRDGDLSSVQVHIPFDSEYQLMFKELSGFRRRVEINIDGADLGDSIIVGPHETTWLERYLESNKKFKFVPVTNETVADPTSSENGTILIKVWKEITPPKNPGILRSASFDRMPFPHTETFCDTQGLAGHTFGSTAEDHTFANCSSDQPGATVEGSYSTQSFYEVGWNGDFGEPLVFKFKVLGKEQKSERVSAGQFCPECGIKVAKKHKFCYACGQRLIIS